MPRANFLPMLILLLAACPATKAPDADEVVPPTVILVSLDGFRADYFDRAQAPTLHRLAAEGVHADALTPGFVSKTFPNHYAIATGLYPEHNGIVENYFSDPNTGQSFEMTSDADNSDPSWFLGEPIWVTAELQGVTTATCFWVGSEAPIEGVQATYWLPYDGGMSWNDRVDQVLAWLDMPAELRPHLVTLYFEEPDGKGHTYGPEGDEVIDEVEALDVELDRLVTGLSDRGILDETDLIVLSDHGMSETSDDRVTFLDDCFDTWANPVESWGPVAAVRPAEADIDAVVAATAPLEHAWCARKEDLPERLHYSDSDRIAPVQCLADDGWSITTRSWAASNPGYYVGGTHGYDNSYESMQGLFVARGPHFAEGVTVDRFENVEVYGIIADILGLVPAPTDGDLTRVGDVFR